MVEMQSSTLTVMKTAVANVAQRRTMSIGENGRDRRVRAHAEEGDVRSGPQKS